MDEPIQVWKNHSHLYRRLQKTFYYGHTKKPIIECSSLPLTEVTVNLIEKSIAYERNSLGNLDVNYASHILHQASISPASIIVAMIYLERLKSSNLDYLRQSSPCELFLVSLVIASKFLFDKGEDEMIYNDEWAEFGNLDIDDLNRIEGEFLNALNWFCYVDPQCFMDQLTKFEGLVSTNEYMKRSNSNMTYTELIALFDYLKYRHKNDFPFWADLIDFAKSICICYLAYCAALGVLMLSFSIVFSLHYAILSQHKMAINDNFTLEANPIDSIAFDFPIKSAQIQTTFFASRQNFTFKSFDQINYHLLLKQKHNRLLKCS